MSRLRAVLHAHSDWSYDGRWSLRAIARLYGALGVRAVLMSEHDTGFDPDRFAGYRAECAAASTARCTLVPGIEYSCPKNDIHILAWGLDRFLAEHRPVAETLERVAAAGGAAVLAHPVRRQAWRQFDPAWVPLLSGIELWNRKSDGIMWGAEAWALIRETGLPATVGQDFHRLRQLYPLEMRFDTGTAADAANGPAAGTVPAARFQAGFQAGLESALVAALRAGRGRPAVFGAPLLSAAGAPRAAPHAALEKSRRGLAAALRGRRRR